MKVDELKKYIKRVFKGKISITHAMIIALILGAGMYTEVNAATTINTETITTKMFVDNGDKAINFGKIKNVTDNGMEAEDHSKLINKKTGRIKNVFWNGMSANDHSTATNFGTIENTRNSGMKAEDRSKAINKKGGTIKNATLNGMTVVDHSTATNFGIIENTNDGGMVAFDSSTATNLGTIQDNRFGMYATNKSKIINKKGGTIKDSSEDGMYANDHSTATNYGTIKDTDVNGMKATNHSKIINEGTINVDNDSGIGMGATNISTAINTKKGEIYLNSTNGIGMYAIGTGSTIVNLGKIYLNGSMVTADFNTNGTTTPGYNGMDTYNNKGMEIVGGAKMINKGQIIFKGN